MDEEEENDLQQAQQWAVRPPPLAPYWEGRTFDDALQTPMEALQTEADKAMLYERLFALIDRNDDGVTYQALSQLKRAFEAEVRDEEDRYAENLQADQSQWSSRLEGILAAVEQRLPAHPELLEQFCAHFFLSSGELQTRQIRHWLEHLDASQQSGQLLTNSLLAARILFGSFDSTWENAGIRLLEALDDEDMTVRACAAYQIGTFCRLLAPGNEEHDPWDRNLAEDQLVTKGMAPLADYWELIRNKEIERAGVAGAFWNSAPTWTINADDWLLTLLEQAEYEPYIGYFPCNLGFDAHERFSQKPAAIRRLIDSGQVSLALEAATEANEPVPGMEPLLMELGESEDVESVRRASWTLAYTYNRLHPKGERHGFVQRESTHPDYDLFLLFSPNRPQGIPYAVVLYPMPPRQHWSQEEAEEFVDQVFPSSARGEVSQDPFTQWDYRWYQRGYVSFSSAGEERNTRGVSRITIGYRSNVYWHPLLSSADVGT